MSGGKMEFAFSPDPRAGAIAAWITSPNQVEPIQAVGGWLR
jgi:stage V sporulation protein SpoVS